MEAEVTEVLLMKSKSRSPGNSTGDEANLALKSYSSGLKWIFLDYSSLWRAGLSWSIFFLLTIGVPVVSHFVFSCPDCDPSHQRPFDAIVQLSLSLFAALSFVSISSFARKYGLRKFLFIDKLCDESEKVRQGYTQQLHRSMKLLSAFILPCFLVDSAYKIWWFSSVGSQIPYFYNMLLSKVIVCTLLMCSWLYRISICFLVCVLFRLTCYLQLLRLDDFAQVFEKESDVASILIEHLRIRRNLRVISHRFRLFILSTLILVTISQFISLLVTTEPSTSVDLATAGELAVILHHHFLSIAYQVVSDNPNLTTLSLYAAVLTYACNGAFHLPTKCSEDNTQSAVCYSACSKWHACATVDSFDGLEEETPTSQIAPGQTGYSGTSNWDSDNEEGDGDDALDNTNLVPIYAHTVSYQKRQALVTYFEHNRAGITVYGFMLDRTWLHTIFAIQLSLTLWIFNKTIGIS